jgi:cell division protein FtsB
VVFYIVEKGRELMPKYTYPAPGFETAMLHHIQKNQMLLGRIDELKQTVKELKSEIKELTKKVGVLEARISET